MKALRQPIQTEFMQFEQAFSQALAADNTIISNVLDYIHTKRGKQLRPILVLLSAAICKGVTDISRDRDISYPGRLVICSHLLISRRIRDTPRRSPGGRWTIFRAFPRNTDMSFGVIPLRRWTAGLRSSSGYLRLFATERTLIR